MPKVWFSFTLSFLLFLVFASLVFWIVNPFSQEILGKPVSPIPTYLNLFANAQVNTINIWSPSPMVLGANTGSIALSAQSALSYDVTSDSVLVSKNPDEKLPMASLTKIMTAIIALENRKSDDRYVVGTKDLVGEDSMGLSDGEIVSLEELLYGLILHSGNDAAETLAENFPGGRDAFIQAMNRKAQALGLVATHFTNPTGLEGDGNQYTSAHDLLVITKYALDNFPLFQQVVSTFDYTIPQTDTHKAFYLENETNLLTSYPGVVGVKTGYTPEAGLCLVTYLHYSGHDIIAVILNSENRRQEMKDVLDYSLRKLGITPPAHG